MINCLNSILVVDIETTGFGNHECILEIGIAGVDIQTGHTFKVFDSLVWERGVTREQIDNSWIAKNSTINSDLIYNEGINLQKLLPNIQNIINLFPLGITAFNNAFDFRFLENRGLNLGTKLPCPMKVSTDIIKLQHIKRAGYKYPTVEQAWKYYFPDIEYNELHRGFDDAYHEAKIIYEMIKRKEFKITLLNP